MESQTSSDVLMIRPVRFAANLQTAESNRFQSSEHSLSATRAQEAAAAEFDALAARLRDAGVAVHVIDDTDEPHTPDSIFPNNWVSFHADGTVVLYPMLAPNRRLERREDVLARLSAEGYRIKRVIDLTAHESSEKFLEGTGSLVLDRERRIAYACISPRTDLDVLGDFAQQLDYDVVAFEAHDRKGVPIYHTNVVMCIGARFAVVCAECIRADERRGVLDALRASGRSVLEISITQLENFAGNMLELRRTGGGAVIAMSARALAALSEEQRGLLAQYGQIVASPIPTIETLGGGSVRCMLAEIHLPKK